MIFVRLTFSLVIIYNSFRNIRNHGSIHINVEVLNPIHIYNKSDSIMTQYIIYHSFYWAQKSEMTAKSNSKFVESQA